MGSNEIEHKTKLHIPHNSKLQVVKYPSNYAPILSMEGHIISKAKVVGSWLI